MKKLNTLFLVFLISSLTIGYAAIATKLTLMNDARVANNVSDFQVYFSSAETENTGSSIISQNGNTITYTTQPISNVNDSSTLSYIVNNNSSQYDANVTISFNAIDVINNVDYSSYYTITKTGVDTSQSTLVSGKSSVNGTFVVTLTSAVPSDIQIEFTITLNINAIERTAAAQPAPVYKIQSGDLDTVGSEVCIGTECFYVIGQYDETHVKLLAKYNLNVGSNTKNTTIGIQDPDVRGYVDDLTIYGNVPYSSDNYWYDGNGLDSDYGDSYPAYVYNGNTVLSVYIGNYVDYLTQLGANVSGRMIKLEELSALGCVVSRKTCSQAPPWLYYTTFWTGTAGNDERMWYLDTHHYLSLDDFNFYRYDGVRPVIILEK